jgi:hypothetical protein
MVYFELGRTPLYINKYIRMICYWLKLLETDNCILKNSSILITIISFDYFNLSLADEHVGDVTIPTQVIEYNQNMYY